MQSKIGRYFIYVIRFINSSDKRKVLKELVNEIKSKGLVVGVKSLLHKKSQYHFNEIDQYEGIVPGSSTGRLSIKEYNKEKKITLPNVLNPKVSIIIPT